MLLKKILRTGITLVFLSNFMIGFIPRYTRTILTDKLHEIARSRTDYEIISDITMKKI